MGGTKSAENLDDNISSVLSKIEEVIAERNERYKAFIEKEEGFKDESKRSILMTEKLILEKYKEPPKKKDDKPMSPIEAYARARKLILEKYKYPPKKKLK